MSLVLNDNNDYCFQCDACPAKSEATFDSNDAYILATAMGWWESGNGDAHLCPTCRKKVTNEVKEVK